MGFETQEEAERWAENMEFRAEQRAEEKLLASASSMETLASMEKCLLAGLNSAKDCLVAAYKLGVVDGQIKMLSVNLKADRDMSQALNEGDGSYKP